MERRNAQHAAVSLLLARNTWYAAAFATTILITMVTAKYHGHRLRGLRHGQQGGEISEADLELTAQEELWSLSDWMMDQGSDIAVWRPNGGEHPLCPPRNLHHIDPALCDYPACNEDIDCASETDAEASGAGDNETSSYACCYNGCVNTCSKKLDPPIAFDWLEEFRANEGRRDELSGVREGASEELLQLHARAFPEVIALPGGCVITATQYKELEEFRKNAHVNKCFCDKGGVSCEVSQVNLSER
ncbi:hypothetical protein B7P43_G08669 [Cryptotermes secundus]|uniref:WAP domain-containing protein n=1 Tax=Cryptotermes secundus TaxID=105785 RepID=A0A2J7PCB5_9NEOP|nr:uncharacterized protein LOC111874908 isoform X2 [Cryptotermes secundus]PNF13979.1 hypothetical protein B7P43_G08669 [Cryptotermes secundus]